MSALLTTKEMAAILRISPQKLVEHAKRRIITGAKIGGRWRFNPAAVLAAKKLSAP